MLVINALHSAPQAHTGSTIRKIITIEIKNYNNSTNDNNNNDNENDKIKMILMHCTREKKAGESSIETELPGATTFIHWASIAN